MSKKIIRINASAIKESKCFRHLWLQAVEGWTEGKLNNDIHYGSCFHKFAEMMEITNGDISISCLAAQELWRSKEEGLYIKDTKKFLNIAHLTMACQFYAKERLSNSIFTGIEYLKNPVDGSPMVEQKFSIPLYEDDDLLILLQGTIDGMAKIRGGCHVLPDWKTTTAYNQEEYFSTYLMSPQLKTYYYGLCYYRDNYPDSPIGQVLAECKGQMGAFIFGAFLSAGKIVEFKRSEPLWFNPGVMDTYRRQLQLLVSRIVDHHKESLIVGPDFLPLPEGSFNGACSTFTGLKCRYFRACSAEVQMNGSPALVRHVLRQNFAQREYNPLDFGGGQKQTNEKDNASV